MICRLVAVAHKQSRIELQKKLDDNKDDSCNVAEILKSIAQQSKSSDDNQSYGEFVANKIKQAGGVDAISDKCDDVILSHGSEYRVFLSQKLPNNRALLYRIIKIISHQSSNSDDNLLKAIEYIMENRSATREFLDNDINLSFASEFWKKRVLSKHDGQQKIKRKELETCVRV